MPPLSNKRKKQIASAHRALEGAKKWRARKRAEKARLEADPSGSLAKGPSFESESASAQDQPRGSQIESTPSGNEEPSAAQVMTITLDQDGQGRRRSRRVRAR
ncbi:unnamed protein product [Rhizoctonia solani]|uniref:Uncharacterized protein n=1 Tax=Rhizoctonia solani TaxID=456999 RepID=A0A8H2XML5_9AGAM|nr:unnamed protein product [Rhizoctonia solani]